MQSIITSFFTDSGIPTTGLSPVVDIIEVTPSGQTVLINQAAMEDVGGGFYKYVFLDTDGYTDSGNFLIRSDGGAGLALGERYGVAKLGPEEAQVIESSVAHIVDSVWDESVADHTTPGSFGEFIQSTATLSPGEIMTISDAVWDETLAPHNIVGSTGYSLALALDLMRTLLKYSANRTRIDVTAKTLTVYDDDGTTPIKVFTLHDSTGTQSVTEVYERRP